MIGLDQCGIEIPSIEENGQTYEENALIKARTMHRLTGLMTIADDSGLEVDCLQGAPGIFSARFAGPQALDEENNQKLLRLLEDKKNRKARFKTAIVLVGNEVQQVFIGTIDGNIAIKPAGNEGFGYDPLFIPEGYDKTFAEIGQDTKNRISHRAKAMEKLKNYFQRNLS